ncbi:MAG TPA: GNAT family N-acetyltransferase [Microvirga sp.]|jgi:GNAT superfamily N-acetyltransferase|nr:GNAT family N-acetyltransferase [Microvirga sp.]
MDRIEVLRRFDAEVRTRTEAAPGFAIAWDGPVLRMVGPGPEASANGVLASRLDEASADAAIAGTIAFFRDRGSAFEWKLYDYDSPADLASRLAAAGLEPEEPETFVAFPVETGARFRDPPPGVRIERVDDPATFGAIEQVNGAVYGRPDHARWLAATVAAEKRGDPDALSVHAAFAGDEPVAVAWMRHRRGDAFGSLWGGATLAPWRGRGLYSALVGARVAEARARGCRWLTVDCSPMSLPILVRCGFTPLAVTTPYIWSP